MTNFSSQYCVLLLIRTDHIMTSFNASRQANNRFQLELEPHKKRGKNHLLKSCRAVTTEIHHYISDRWAGPSLLIEKDFAKLGNVHKWCPTFLGSFWTPQPPLIRFCPISFHAPILWRPILTPPPCLYIIICSIILLSFLILSSTLQLKF